MGYLLNEKGILGCWKSQCHMVTEQSHTEELYSARNRNDPLFSEPGMGVLPGMGTLRESKRDIV